MVLKLGRFGQQIRNNWKVLKFGAGEDQLDDHVRNDEPMSRGISYTK